MERGDAARGRATLDPACAVAHGEDPLPRGEERSLVVVFATPLAGHLLHWGPELGFETTLLEPDPRAAEGAHGAHRVVEDPSTVVVDARTDVVVTDHHRPDLGPSMAPLVRARPRFVGIIGSPRHAAPHEAALRAEGVAEELVATVRRPIGLDIGSRTPAEIALSVLAGLIAERSGRTGGVRGTPQATAT